MSEPDWNMIFVISMIVSAVVSAAQVTLHFRDNSYLKYFVVGTVTSFLQFFIFQRLYLERVYENGAGFDGVADVAINMFVINPLFVAVVNYFISKYYII